MNEASGPTSDNPEGVPDGSAAREDAPNNSIESVERTAALEQANPPTAKSERSDRVATIQFSGETTELGDAERDILRQVAALHQQRGGMIRVVGRHGGAPDQDNSAEDDAGQVSLERANAVAQELIRLGVSRQNVRASADATGAEKTDTRTAEIYFIY
jgi:outer membrane protein OmpA-like peptidoglycan-associated protein